MIDIILNKLCLFKGVYIIFRMNQHSTFILTRTFAFVKRSSRIQSVDKYQVGRIWGRVPNTPDIWLFFKVDDRMYYLLFL